MSDTLIVFKTLIENSWTVLSSIEVLDLGFSFAEMLLGILFFLLLVHILKLLIFGGAPGIGTMSTDVLSSIRNEQIAAMRKENEIAEERMLLERKKAREDFNNLRDANNFYNPSTNPKMHGPPAPKHLKHGLSELNARKHKD